MIAPPHFEKASTSWRFAAAAINVVAVGSFVVVAEALARRFAAPGAQSTTVRLILLGLVTLYWLACALKRKSLGGTFCLLESRRQGFDPLSFRLCLLRSLHFYAASVIAYTPSSVLPSGAETVRAMLLFALAALFALDAIILVLTSRSVADRLFKVTVFRLNLPDHLRPKMFGQRIV